MFQRGLTMTASRTEIGSPCTSDKPPPAPLETMGHVNTEDVMESFVIYCMAICLVMFAYSLGYALYLWCMGERI